MVGRCFAIVVSQTITITLPIIPQKCYIYLAILWAGKPLRTLRRKMFCRNPNCEYHDHGGSKGTLCPNCDHPVGKGPTHEMIQQAVGRHPSATPYMRASHASVASKEWSYYRVADHTTPRTQPFLCRASSSDDARGLVKVLYRQKGWRYDADMVSIGLCNPDTPPIGVTYYYKWQGSGSKKRVVKCNIL